MFNEREFIARVEAAGPDEFRRMLAQPSRDEETALRHYFGPTRYARLHELAARQPALRARPLGNVVVIHGIMGGELTLVGAGGAGTHVWVHLLRLIGGAFGQLRLDDDGTQPPAGRPDALATGIYKKDYGEQLLRLSEHWNVRAFWYDWRKDLNHAADMLSVNIASWFGSGAPVHLVAHSMGGLVARTFIARHEAQWQSMNDGGGRGGRLVMLGTPNHGSYAVPQILTGLEGMVRKLAAIDFRHSPQELAGIAATFPGVYQMMPSLHVVPAAAPLYQATTFGDGIRVSQRHLDAARAFHDMLRDVIDEQRMTYIAGFNQQTFCGVRDNRVRDAGAYERTRAGDGRVPHTLGLLDGVTTYYVDEVHGKLPGNDVVIEATLEMLRTGTTSLLPTQMPTLRALPQSQDVPGDAAADVERARHIAGQLQSLRNMPDAAAVSGDERVLSSLLLDGWLGTAEDGDVSAAAFTVEQLPATPSQPPLYAEVAPTPAAPETPAGTDLLVEPVQHHAPLQLRVLRGGIDDDGIDADAIAVGHYVGVQPQNAERALDVAISGAAAADDELLLTELTERGTLRGELAQPFLLPDPRNSARMIVIAGMGAPGRFQAPELAVLARELSWTLGRLGRRRLATVLIGAGAGNLGVQEAVAAWLRGLLEAGTGADDTTPALREVTFIDHDAERVLRIDAAIRAQLALRAGALPIAYQPLDDAAREALLAEAQQRAAEKAAQRVRDAASLGDEPPPTEPTRLTITLDRRADRAVYRIAALTSTASVPEREVVIDQRIIDEANNRLPSLRRVEDQLETGRVLEQLILGDVRAALTSAAPLVLVLDATTARIHWEMLAQPAAASRGAAGLADGFLGTTRGLTRQLRTSFAPIPEPPPPAQRPLRVLVIADPAGDAPLPGAAREGFELADLFRRFEQLYPNGRRVEVRLLSGPRQATPYAVLRELFSSAYDVLHFAGHCSFRTDDPAASGWIFDGGFCLSAHELRRVDRVPKFVFSNACESGVTPDRSDRRTAALAPSFAEAFFERGVANFVCTAWPVGDGAARSFALHLYAGLLGMGTPEDPALDAARAPLSMQEAVFEARSALVRTAADPARAADVSFWGAYQHYGSPSFRLFTRRDLHRVMT